MELTDCGADVSSVSFTYPFLKGIDLSSPPSRISIPNKYLDAMANMERQYWEIKSKHFNILIFFKKGKFYELYDNDAVIANREFGLKMVVDTTNRGKMRLAGVPEQSFTEWARLFVFRGYKVGRVEQMKEDEKSTPAAKAKIVPRELVEVLTPGTLKDPSMLSEHGEVFVLALAPIRSKSLSSIIEIDAFAVDLSRRVAFRCFCGCETTAEYGADRSKTNLPSVKWENRTTDVVSESSLRTLSALLQQLHPKEVVMVDAEWISEEMVESRSLLAAAQAVERWTENEGFSVERIAKCTLPSSCFDGVFSAEVVMRHYFASLRLQESFPLFNEAVYYRSHLVSSTQKLSEGDGTQVVQVPSRPADLLLFEKRYDIGMVLDPSTVSNLELISNLQDGTEKHSLNEALNFCVTNGGRRLFRSWLLRPSSCTAVIRARQDAVKFLAENHLSSLLCNKEDPAARHNVGQKRVRLIGAECGTCTPDFSSVVSVDFERFLSRLSDMKQSGVSNIAYVDPMVEYRKNLGIILSTVQAVSMMVEWAKYFCAQCERSSLERAQCMPVLLQELLRNVTDAAESTVAIEKLFDRDAAAESGLLIPAPGTSDSYDKVVTELRSIESQLEEVRRRAQKENFAGANVQFTDLGKDLFLFEVSTVDAPKVTPPGMIERARSSKSVKYVVQSVKCLIDRHKEATVVKANSLLGVLCTIATRICDHLPQLFTASSALSYMDCLINLARLHHNFPTPCYPAISASASSMETNTDSNVVAANLKASDLVHPLLASKNPVPNSVCLGAHEGRVLLLTGPNMAGKSTLMRTVAVNLILAQLGGPVLASEMIFSPVDRIFTRIGARDASHKGQSTLFVELSETADILRGSTARSMCLIDELGRGTSTHDGMSIAYATLHALTHAIPEPPLAIFSTHYHALALEQARMMEERPHDVAPSVQLGYMDFVLSASPTYKYPKLPSDSSGPSLSPRDIGAVSCVVFLYRLVRGICARSYGVEVALMAGIPPSLVTLAKRKSEELSLQTALHEDTQTLQRFINAYSTIEAGS